MCTKTRKKTAGEVEEGEFLANCIQNTGCDLNGVSKWGRARANESAELCKSPEDGMQDSRAEGWI